MDRAALALPEASVYIGLEVGSDWLLRFGCPVARCDIRKHGATRPVWRWRVETLDAFLKSREIAPGSGNPHDQ